MPSRTGLCSYFSCCVPLLLLFGLGLIGCLPQEQQIDLDPSPVIFSEERIQFDTLISELRSRSHSLRLYNPNKKAIILDQIWLESGLNSPYSIWINGKRGKSFESVLLLGQDSLLMVVEALFKSRKRAQIVSIDDALRLRSVAGEQQLPLQTWVRDVIAQDTVLITEDTYWEGGPARSIGTLLTITKGATLHLGKNTHLFFAADAKMDIQGRLLATGTAESPIVFTSQRQDGPYKDAPGQWKGLRFAAHKGRSSLKHVIISNAELGIRLGSLSAPGGSLDIESSIIRHMSQGCLLSYRATSSVRNTLMYHSKLYLVMLYGGSHRYVHCTLSNIPNTFLRTHALFQGQSHLPSDPTQPDPLTLSIESSILWGTLGSALHIDETFLEQSQLSIQNCLIRSNDGKHLGTGHNLWANTPAFPAFVDHTAYNYELKASSPAIDRSKPDPNDPKGPLTHDIRDTPRDERPDLGAYEWVTD